MAATRVPGSVGGAGAAQQQPRGAARRRGAELESGGRTARANRRAVRPHRPPSPRRRRPRVGTRGRRRRGHGVPRRPPRRPCGRTRRQRGRRPRRPGGTRPRARAAPNPPRAAERRAADLRPESPAPARPRRPVHHRRLPNATRRLRPLPCPGNERRPPSRTCSPSCRSMSGRRSARWAPDAGRNHSGRRSGRSAPRATGPAPRNSRPGSGPIPAIWRSRKAVSLKTRTMIARLPSQESTRGWGPAVTGRRIWWQCTARRLPLRAALSRGRSG